MQGRARRAESTGRMLAQRSAIVTGAGRGIGAAVARLLGQHGASVLVNDLDEAAAQASAAAVTAAGGCAFALSGSVTDDGFPESLVAAAVARHGALDIVVNNAGFLWDGVVHKMDDEQFAAVLDCHLTAPFRLARAAAEHMRAAARAELAQGGAPRDRCFVNVSSTSGLHGNLLTMPLLTMALLTMTLLTMALLTMALLTMALLTLALLAR